MVRENLLVGVSGRLLRGSSTSISGQGSGRRLLERQKRNKITSRIRPKIKNVKSAILLFFLGLLRSSPLVAFQIWLLHLYILFSLDRILCMLELP